MMKTLLRNGRLLTCTGGPDERPVAGDLLVQGDRIAAVGPVGEVDAWVVDLHGATVLPGLGDAHTHVSWPLDFVFDHAGVAKADPAAHMLDVASVVRTFVESGYTTIIGAGVLHPLDDVLARDAIDAGRIPGPRIVPSGLMVAAVDGLGGDGEMMQVAGDAAGLRRIVAEQCDSGVRALKLFISGDGVVPEFPSEDCYMSDEMLSAAVEEADRYGAFLTVHARGSKSVAMAARTGVRIVHHACFLDDEAVAALVARGDDVWVCPGLHYLHAMVHGHAEAWGVTPEKIRASGYDRELVAQVEGMQALREAGVQLVAGGDFGHQWTHHGTYARELERYVETGMTAAEAIHTATRNIGAAARLEVGRLEPGALADLLVVDGDPTADVTVLQDVDRRRAVFKGGEAVWVNPLVLQ
jgi:imidazolonepropionase-like amidohydrolase